ncbi:MAG TPA: PD-(D/E)XK nuclease family protein [Phycisphaerae bacterium]|nr:PD-(D/E)XK nuclease family protein [Phycisphaerae bacterium]
MVYSHSRLGSFETCPRKYWYQYIGRPKIEAVQSIEAFLGSRVHGALEEVYKRRIGGQVITADELVASFDACWDRKWSSGVQIVQPCFSAEDYRRVGRESLLAYHARYAPFDQARTLRLEAKVVFSLDGGGSYRVQGYIDRLDQRDDGTYEIHDYKTSRRVPTQEEADADRQLALYQIGVEQMWPDGADVDLVWHYLRFDKEIRSRRTAEQQDALRQRCIALIDDIESRGRAEEGFPTSPSNLCPWCDYRSLCPAQRHHCAVEDLPPEQFKADSGVRLVDLLARLKCEEAALHDQAAALETQIESVTETLIRFARQQGVTSVCGSCHTADVRSRRKIVLPESGSSQRDDLEAALRATGLYDVVAVPNWQKLNSLWLGDALPEATRPALGRFIQIAEDVTARLKSTDKNNAH